MNQRDHVLFAQLPGIGRHDRRIPRYDLRLREQNGIVQITFICRDGAAVGQMHGTTVEICEIRGMDGRIRPMTAAAAGMPEHGRTAGSQTGALQLVPP